MSHSAFPSSFLSSTSTITTFHSTTTTLDFDEAENLYFLDNFNKGQSAQGIEMLSQQQEKEHSLFPLTDAFDPTSYASTAFPYSLPSFENSLLASPLDLDLDTLSSSPLHDLPSSWESLPHSGSHYSPTEFGTPLLQDVPSLFFDGERGSSSASALVAEPPLATTPVWDPLDFGRAGFEAPYSSSATTGSFPFGTGSTSSNASDGGATPSLIQEGVSPDMMRLGSVEPARSVVVATLPTAVGGKKGKKPTPAKRGGAGRKRKSGKVEADDFDDDVDDVDFSADYVDSSTTTTTTSTCTKRVKSEDEPPSLAAALSGSSSGSNKDKFNGTRNTKIQPLDLSAPTMSRSYIIPASTGRKLLPPAITAKLASSGKNKRGRRRSETPLFGGPLGSGGPLTNEEGQFDPSAVPEELLSAIEEKRRSNTLAARTSRLRKKAHLDGLTTEMEEAKKACREWKERAERAEEQVRRLLARRD